MLFNSFIFLLFFPIVFGLYWFVFKKNLKVQNLFLLLASYVFYGWWDWRFLFLIAFSSLVDFYVGPKIEQASLKTTKNLWLWVSIVINIGFLAYFKYANFFIDSFVRALEQVGMQANISSLQVILPVGISFYTFQTLSYSLDIYKGNMRATKDPIAFFAYVSFFPQLVAGPIERAQNLLPQFFKQRVFELEKAKSATRQIVWGFFKKMVVADTCARHADYIFANHDSLQGSLLVLGAIYFAFQIYGDFSGYSDIAIGTARLLGFDLMTNFNMPYFSKNVAEFWKRWHISLSSWFRDYVYILLGGNRRSMQRNIFNVFVVFTLSGFWHGANWTFVIWGALNGLFFIPLFVFGKNKVQLESVSKNKCFPGFKELFQMGWTFFLICTTWVFFRAESLGKAHAYLSNTVDKSLFASPGNPNLTYLPLLFIPMLLIMEWINRNRQHQFDIVGLPIWLRWPAYYVLLGMIVQFGQGDVSFIYFQF
jgi:D-alanyl-lipoteichoic acid acyltransferase DltB (MBOAT superfamily)